MNGFKYCENVNIENLVNEVSKVKLVATKSKYNKVRYFNCPCSFDIETSSFVDGDEKRAIMYLWQLDINGCCMYGRTWEEFITVMYKLSAGLDLSEEKRLVIYVHNLAYEFQFMRKWFEWISVFARENLKPMKAVTTSGIEFRCSYILSGYSLTKVAENLHSHKIGKLTEIMDYKKIRTPETKLDDDTLKYSLNDILIVEYFIAEEIQRNNNNIAEIPLTNTGYVRKYIQSNCSSRKIDKREREKFRELIRGLTIEPEEYRLLKRAFQGGFTHANAYRTMQTIENVSSIDFTSSYPTVMIQEQFPMSKGMKRKITSVEQIEKYITNYCCIFDIMLTNVRPKIKYENIISYSKCLLCENAVLNNGRVVSADRLATSITDIDYKWLKEFYEWDECNIGLCYIYKRRYLPKPIVESVIKLYKDKTELKDVEGKEIEYMHSKGMLNSAYGMIVTDICPDEVIYNAENEWIKNKSDFDTELEKYNAKRNRFLFYPWGVYVTAYARQNLYTGIKEFGMDYIYADTDSIKATNIKLHTRYIEQYNKRCIMKSFMSMKHYGISVESTSPKTIKGKTKPIGVWDDDGTYKRFKTLGAKRYLTEDENGKLKMTVAGVQKKAGIEYLKSLKGDPFDNFKIDLEIPEGSTGKQLHSYIHDETNGVVKDCDGNLYNYHELSAINLSEAGYNFSISSNFADYLENIKVDILPLDGMGNE